MSSTVGNPGDAADVGGPVGGKRANAAWNRLLRTLVKDVPAELQKAQAARKRLTQHKR